jgi:hypothetical protein
MCGSVGWPERNSGGIKLDLNSVRIRAGPFSNASKRTASLVWTLEGGGDLGSSILSNLGDSSRIKSGVRNREFLQI